MSNLLIPRKGSKSEVRKIALTEGVQLKPTIVSADGAIPVTSGLVIITKGTAAALTLAAPSAGTDDGNVLEILSATAAAHTITNAAPGFNAPASAADGDVATFGAAKGNNIVLVAYNGAWYVKSSVNVTLA